MRPNTELIYIHDPMCSWCWGFKPTFDTICKRMGGRLSVRRLLGGLAPDTDSPMPVELQNHLQATWRLIQQRIPGTPFNFDFWRDCAPRRSTWPACRAVIAARALDAAHELPMIAAIQHAYYLDARNPSDDATLIDLAEKLGMDRDLFSARLHADRTHSMLADEIAQAARLGVNGFPSLRLRAGESITQIAVDYTDVDAILGDIAASLPQCVDENDRNNAG